MVPLPRFEKSELTDDVHDGVIHDGNTRLTVACVVFYRFTC